MKRWLLLVGGGLLVFTLVITGIGPSVLAQEDEAGTSAAEEPDYRQAYLDALAAELGVTSEELESALTAAQLAMVDLWAEEARERVEQGEPFFPGFGGIVEDRLPGAGVHIIDRAFGGPMDLDIFGGAVVEAHGVNVAELAGFLGIGEDEVIDAMRDGMSLVEIAEANGKTSDELRAYLIEKATERIDAQLQESTDDGVDATGTPESATSLETV